MKHSFEIISNMHGEVIDILQGQDMGMQICAQGTPGSALKDNSWWAWGIMWGYSGLNSSQSHAMQVVLLWTQRLSFESLPRMHFGLTLICCIIFQ